MRLIALETSTEYCSVALWLDGAVAERCEKVGQKHSTELMPMLDGLLKEAGLVLRELDGIAFGKGPGSFTGVRIACGVTQGLALGADLPVLGVCTLEALAEASGKAQVIAALDARMDEFYLAAYQRQGADWQEIVAPCLCRAEEAPPVSGADWFGAGSGFAVSDVLLQCYAAQLKAIDAEAVPRAAAIAAIAARGFAAGLGMDAAQALPLYLRDKVALTTQERAAVKAGHG